MKQQTRNITLALPQEILKQLKILAAKRGTSVSAMLKEELEALLQQESDYMQAYREFMEVANRGFELGTYGEARWMRDALHER